MWERVAQIVLRPQLQQRRIRGSAVAVLLVRLFEGIVCWAIVFRFYAPTTVSPWAVHLAFALYTLANVALFIPQRREAMTARMVWLDIAANLLPMAAGAHWSGGVYSPLLAIFVLKICSYGLNYGVDVAVQSLAATLLIAAGLAAVEHAGVGSAATIDDVDILVRQRLTLAVAGVTFCIGVGGMLRSFRLLQDREQRLADAVLEKDRLYHESLRHQQDLRRLSHRMIAVSESTMQRVARDLHDDLGQALTAVKIDLSMVDRALRSDDPVRQQLRAVREQIGAILQSVRTLSQLLRPAVLDDLGLVAAMQSYVARVSERIGVRICLEAPPVEHRLPRDLEVSLYRVLQEALTNVARHAGARHVDVRLQADGTSATLEIADDGCGFAAAQFLDSPPPGHGMGILGMRERVATHGGQLAIASRPGAGTRVTLTIGFSLRVPSVEGRADEDTRPLG